MPIKDPVKRAQYQHRYNKQWRKEHPDYNKIWLLNNPGYSAKRNHDWWLNNKEYFRDFYRKNALRIESRKKRIGMTQAKSKVQYAIKTGRLPSLKKKWIKCTDCPMRATQYDHRDYSRPLDVEAVCQSCNMRRGSAKTI